MLKQLFTVLIGLYKMLISPLLPPACRYYPTCSDYARGAVQTHGALQGTALAARRLFRCHPLSEGGYDPVPPSPGHAKIKEGLS